MASVVGICNEALVSLGADTIAALTENSPAARACNARYEDARDSVLRAHSWNCATAKVKLQRLSDDPVFTWAYAYQLPTDCLRVISLASGEDFEVVGRTVETNDSDPALKYVKRLTDPAQMDSLLRSAIAARLAAEIAYIVTKDTKILDAAWTLLSNKLAEAMIRDAEEGQIETSVISGSSWLDVRS